MNEDMKKVDESWKEKVKKDREKIKEKDNQNPENLNLPATFPTLITTMAIQGSVSLGVMENPVSNKSEVNLSQAAFTIDMLSVIKEKTKGNLNEEEEKYLDEVLFNLQRAYISASENKP